MPTFPANLPHPPHSSSHLPLAPISPSPTAPAPPTFLPTKKDSVGEPINDKTDKKKLDAELINEDKTNGKVPHGEATNEDTTKKEDLDDELSEDDKDLAKNDTFGAKFGRIFKVSQRDVKGNDHLKQMTHEGAK